MRNTSFATTLLVSCGLLAVGPGVTPAAAQNGQPAAGAHQGRTVHPQQLVDQTAKVVDKMKSDPHLFALMKQAKGLFIIPRFGRGALVVGASGGAGALVADRNGSWSDPAFYDFGAVSLGAQAGGAGGPVVFLLMNQRAVKAFNSNNKFALNANAGLSIVTYSALARASTVPHDVVVWSDTGGAYAGATVSVSDIVWDSANNDAYYGKSADLNKILNGSVNNSGAEKLKAVLPG
jgi:SH3 domain-containing YSC84-like protein 1